MSDFAWVRPTPLNIVINDFSAQILLRFTLRSEAPNVERGEG